MAKESSEMPTAKMKQAGLCEVIKTMALVEGTLLYKNKNRAWYQLPNGLTVSIGRSK